MESLVIPRLDHTADSLFDAINRLRRRTGKGWWVVSGPFYGHHLEIKAYGTWAQIFRIDGVNHDWGMTETVRAWRDNTKRILTSIEANHQ